MYGEKMSESITCVSCPLGCRIRLNKKGYKEIFTGNECKKGVEYAIREINNPMRFLTTTVNIDNGEEKLLPVRSKNEIPKDMIMRGIIELSKIKVKAPIKCGDLIYKNILETGVDIIASRNIEMKLIKK
jgi:CxxC motif-containing protein